MGAQRDTVAAGRFSAAYGHLRVQCAGAREETREVSEHVLQCLWYDQQFPGEALRTREGHRVRVVSPGWWNHGPGPDFRGAQLEFNGALHSGDVEVHGRGGEWTAHGHHLDKRYDAVILHVVHYDDGAPPVATSEGRPIATLVLDGLLGVDAQALRERAASDEYPFLAAPQLGRCAGLIPLQGVGPLASFLDIAGEWRILSKARALRDRAERAGFDQAVYESLTYACGFSHFKQHFQIIARHLPYERARQLAQKDPLLLEAALLHLGGLLPDALPEGTTAVPHFARLRGLRRDQLDGLRSLPLIWKRVGVRPTNYPERRLAGLARVIARTSQLGLAASLANVWREDLKPLERRRRFEALFPTVSEGFWGTHFTWTGKKLDRSALPIGADRIRSILGNVIVPAALADARARHDRVLEEKVYAFLDALPAESANRVLKAMLPRILGDATGLRLNFRRQQGILQMHNDWCEPNPSCRNCSLYRHLDRDDAAT